MGLAERRLAEKVKLEQFAPFLTELHSITQTSLPVEIDWASFTAYDEYPLNRMKDYLFEPILETFRHVCQDQMGIDAVQQHIESISIDNADSIDKILFEFEHKIVKITVAFGGGAFSYYDSKHMITTLEAKL